jgi:serine/threonine-protein kinase ULK/ATG1
MKKEEKNGLIRGDWELSSVVGSGSFAVVWKAYHVSEVDEKTGDRRVAAVKEINRNKLSPKLVQSLEGEIYALRRINHRNIVRLYDVLERAGHLYLVMEYCTGGDLGQWLNSQGRVGEEVAQRWMQQLAAGMLEMWRHNVVHRDLKPQNLLLFEAEDGSMEVKIADFGFARALGPEKMAETLCGSPLYMAPEILTGHQYDAKADLWSIGAILFEMVCCCKIYEYNEMKDSVYLIGFCRFVGSLHMEGQIRWPC